MKFALLGTGPVLTSFAAAVRASVDDAIVWSAGAASLPDETPGQVGWEWLLGGVDCDAVIVGDISAEPQYEDILRKLAQAGLAMLVTDTRVVDVLFCYELEMIREDSRRPITPAISLLESEPYRRFEQLVTEPSGATLGRVDWIVLERRTTSTDPQTVQALLVDDLIIAQRLAGMLNRVSAMSSGADSNAYRGLGIQFAGHGETLVRWSIEETGNGNGLTVTALGAAARAVLEQSTTETGTRVRLETPDGKSDEVTRTAAESARRVLDAFRASCQGGAPAVAWIDVARSMELAEAVDKSLVRGRTIDLNFDEVSEAGAFKSIMTSLGCGVLLASLAVLLVGVTLTGLGVGLLDYWPQFLLIVLSSFLLLQALRLVVPAKPAHDTDRSDDARQPPEADDPLATKS